jgi:hypothetical protein
MTVPTWNQVHALRAAADERWKALHPAHGPQTSEQITAQWYREDYLVLKIITDSGGSPHE